MGSQGDGRGCILWLETGEGTSGGSDSMGWSEGLVKD